MYKNYTLIVTKAAENVNPCTAKNWLGVEVWRFYQKTTFLFRQDIKITWGRLFEKEGDSWKIPCGVLPFRVKSPLDNGEMPIYNVLIKTRTKFLYKNY